MHVVLYALVEFVKNVKSTCFIQNTILRVCGITVLLRWERRDPFFPFLTRNYESKPGRIRSARLGVKLMCMWRLSALGRCGHVNLSADTCRRSTRRNIRVPCLQRARNPTQSNTILPRAPRPSTRRSTRNFRWWCRGINTMAAG